MAKKIENKVGKITTTNDIVKAISEKSKADGNAISQKDAAAVLNYFKDVVQEEFATGSKVQLTGFLTIQMAYRSERKGNNVTTGKAMNIPESVIVSIKAGKSLKDIAKDADSSILKAVKDLHQKKA